MGKQSGKRGLKGLLLGLAATVIVAGFVFFKVFGPNAGAHIQDEYLYIHTGATFEQVLQSLKESGMVKDINSFRLVANTMKLPQHVHAGKYRIKPGMSNFAIIRMLRSGLQVPVKLVINKLRTKGDLIHLLSANLEADSARLLQMLSDKDFLTTLDADAETVMGLIRPDTYEFYWNTSAENVLKKLKKHNDRFWTAARVQKAQAQGITPMQAVIIASIVEEETNIGSDKPYIATVYLNRLRRGMKLQADPTVKFAIGDFTIRRITGAMLLYESPYNTYMYGGLPPGPICTPSGQSLNAVLDAPHNGYLYFCAKDDLSGRTAFASSLTEHVNNANAYHRALNKRGIH